MDEITPKEKWTIKYYPTGDYSETFSANFIRLSPIDYELCLLIINDIEKLITSCQKRSVSFHDMRFGKYFDMSKLTIWTEIPKLIIWIKLEKT